MGLMLLQAVRTENKIDYQRGVLELYIEPPHFTKFKQPRGAKRLSLRSIFNIADRGLRCYDRHRSKSLRARALRHAENWILEHQDANGSWGGIEPCYLLSAMALKANGYRNDHPVLKKAIEASRELIWNFPDCAMYMPCVSVNWDTALAGKALLDSGLPSDHPAPKQTANWFIDHRSFKGVGWLSHQSSGRDPGDRMAQAKSIARRWMALALGYQLYLRNFLGAVRAPRDRCQHQRAMDQARGELAQIETESRRRMGREPALG